MKVLASKGPIEKKFIEEADKEINEAVKLMDAHHLMFDEALRVVNNEKTLEEALKTVKLNEGENEGMDERIKLLANYLEIDPADIEQESYDKNVFSINGGEEEYLVLTYDEARKYAEEDIENFIDECGIEGFTESFQSWIYNYALDEDWLEELVREEIYYKYSDMDDEEIIEAAIDEGYITAEEAYVVEDEDDFDYPEINPDVDIDELREHLVEAEYNGVGDYAEYIIWHLGEDFLRDAVKHNSSVLDIESIVEECISCDGIAHFIAHYDGNEIELEGGYYAYRIN
jgi:hypothetical protein